ncbi:hypothetical protein GCM10022280_12710 [Sphingomonas swuensis]|uniref:Uncharacterized protein n=1 Tax=Sphingomonas swuensis TaxID=977800 RepID=A0ABP7SSM9_9SPHN
MTELRDRIGADLYAKMVEAVWRATGDRYGAEMAVDFLLEDVPEVTYAITLARAADKFTEDHA